MSAPLPLISLVTPSFNQAAYLAQSLDSVLGQAYPALDYVVVDGGSTDGSRALIEARAPALSWWCSEADDGMYSALNKGFDHTRGEIMGWLNSDDLLQPGALQTVGIIFRDFPDVQWLTSLSLSTWTASGACAGIASIAGYSRQAFLDGAYLPGGARHYGWIPQESTFWRRSLWERAGGQLAANLHLAGDFELWSRFYQHAELVGTPVPLGGFRLHERQKSRAMEDYLREARAALATARRTAGYRTAPIRLLAQRSRAAEMPGLRGFLANRVGYDARRIIPISEGGWRSETYRFL
ncbi:MAG: glycosyltransferase [Opitutae bacterium]|nr:glycosyltransferase [Opitutae bacterium]